MRTLVFFFGLSVVGCGTTSATNTDGGTEGGGQCISAVEGTSCSSSDVACSLGDPCCNGVINCQSGKWVKQYLGCACQTSTFACGATTLTCQTHQVCKKEESGVDGGTASYSCEALPSACTTDESCACIADSGVCTPTGITSCTDSQGNLLVDCMGQ